MNKNELKEEIVDIHIDILRQEMSELSYKELLKIKKESKTFWKDYYEVYRTDTEQSEVQNE